MYNQIYLENMFYFNVLIVLMIKTHFYVWSSTFIEIIMLILIINPFYEHEPHVIDVPSNMKAYVT